jgi:hypothetical protein
MSSLNPRLNPIQKELKYRVERYRLISKYLHTRQQISYLNEMYSLMNKYFTDIHSYSKMKNNENHRKLLKITMEKTKEFLEINQSNLPISDELKLEFKKNLEEFLDKKKYYIDVKILLLQKFHYDITEYIFDFL